MNLSIFLVGLLVLSVSCIKVRFEDNVFKAIGFSSFQQLVFPDVVLASKNTDVELLFMPDVFIRLDDTLHELNVRSDIAAKISVITFNKISLVNVTTNDVFKRFSNLKQINIYDSNFKPVGESKAFSGLDIEFLSFKNVEFERVLPAAMFKNSDIGSIEFESCTFSTRFISEDDEAHDTVVQTLAFWSTNGDLDVNNFCGKTFEKTRTITFSNTSISKFQNCFENLRYLNYHHGLRNKHWSLDWMSNVSSNNNESPIEMYFEEGSYDFLSNENLCLFKHISYKQKVLPRVLHYNFNITCSCTVYWLFHHENLLDSSDWLSSWPEIDECFETENYYSNIDECKNELNSNCNHVNKNNETELIFNLDHSLESAENTEHLYQLLNKIYFVLNSSDVKVEERNQQQQQQYVTQTAIKSNSILLKSNFYFYFFIIICFF